MLGSVILIDNTDLPGFEIPYGLIGGVAAASAAFVFLVVGHDGAQSQAARGQRPRADDRRAAARRWRISSAKAGRACTARPGACAAMRRCGAATACASPECDGLVLNVEIRAMIGFDRRRIVILIIVMVMSLRILREYERAVVFILGRFWRVKGPGMIFIIPVVQQMVRVDLRTVVLDVPPQDVITRDNVSVKVNAVIYFRVVDPRNAIIQVANFLEATSQLAQTTLRAVLGKHELDALLAEREKLNLDIQTVLDQQTDAWGIKVSNVEIKHVDLNESMVRAIARQAEAERERRAKVIHAEGELQASEKLLQAANMLSQRTEAMQLRYLQTLTQIAGDKATTIVFPLPMDLLSPLLGKGKG